MKLPRASGVVQNRQTSTGQVDLAETQVATQGFSMATSFISKHNEERDKSKTQEAINTAMRKTNDWKAENMKRTGKAAEGLTEDFLKFNQSLEDELGSQLSNNSRSMFSDWNIRNAENDRAGLVAYQEKQNQFVKAAAFDDGLTVSQEIIRSNAKDWARGFDHLENTLDLGLQSGVIKPEEFEVKKTEMANRLRGEVGKNYYTQDKHEFMKEIDKFGFGEPEIAAYKQKYKNDLAAEEREKKSLFAEEARIIYAKKDDMKAQAVANSDTSHYFENAEKLRGMGYKAWASELEEEGKLYKGVVTFNAENKNKPLKELVDAAGSLGVGQELDGSSMEFKKKTAIQTEVAKQAKMFDTDPAEFVKGWAQGETMEEIADSRMELQKNQGLFPSKGFQITTALEKKTFKGAWDAGDTKQKTELVMEAFSYGKHAPQVLDEVKVNSALALAPMIGFDAATGLDEQTVEMLVAGVSTKPEMLDESKLGDYSSAAKNSEFYKTLVEVQKKFPTNPDLPQRLKDIEAAMTGIGARMVDPQAGAKFFDGKIESVQADDKLVYFPNSLDADEVEASLDKRKDDLLGKFKTGDRIKDTQIKWALRDAVWVNTAKGFVLADSRSGAYIGGTEMDMIELEPLKKDLAKKKLKESEAINKVSMRRN